MKYIYPACFYKEEDGYSVIFPDFSCGTCGTSLQEAYDMAVDFLYAQIEFMLENGEEIPAPTDTFSVVPSTDFEYENCFTSLVAVDLKEYKKVLAAKNKAVRKNVTIPLWLVEKAEKEHINFSSILQEALREKLGF